MYLVGIIKLTWAAHGVIDNLRQYIIIKTINVG